MDTYEKIRMVLQLEKEFEKNKNLKETWIGITKNKDGKLIARVTQVEEKIFEAKRDIESLRGDEK